MITPNDSPSPYPVERVAFSGLLGEVIHREVSPGKTYERFRRPPGTRTAIVSPDGKILMTKEYRDDTGNVDLRLPGGKVCDTLAEYKDLLAAGDDIEEIAKHGAIRETHEETGFEIRNPELVTKIGAGSSVEWDLYYFLAFSYAESLDGQQLEAGEDIELVWMSPFEIRRAIEMGEMQEYRTVGVMLAHILPAVEARAA